MVLDPAVTEEERMSRRRLIGIDLAWGKQGGTDFTSAACATSGCVELAWNKGKLTLERACLLRSMKEIVEWMEPDRGDWVIAVDAPLVVCNKGKSRAADRQASSCYGKFHAFAQSTNLQKLGKDHRGGQLLRELRKPKNHRTTLVEQKTDINTGSLVFETYPHVVIVELFERDRIIKYKKGSKPRLRRGQEELAGCIRDRLCCDKAAPRLCANDALENLLRVPALQRLRTEFKEHEDLLDGLLCAYTAACLDAGRPLQGLGEVGKGVMITPRVLGIEGPAPLA